MPSEIRNKYRAPVTVQAEAAITANNYSGGSQTVIDNTSSGNGGGCNDIECYIAIPTGGGASTAATCELYMQASYDGGTTYSAEVYRGMVSVPASTIGHFYFGRVMDVPEYCKFKVKAVSYGFTASLIAVPVVMEAQ
jgi:hypothetical protein